jgi:cell wall-associated NlpC family hydrolase
MRRTTTLATLVAVTLIGVPTSSAISSAAAAAPASTHTADKTASVQKAAAPKPMYVAVNVATVWTDPTKVRPVDKPALTNPAHPRTWLHNMTPAQSEDLTDSNRTQTQALYGAKVLVLDQQGAWSQVVVPKQPTPRDARGYPGWIPTVQLTRSPSYAAATKNRPFALIDRGIGTGLFAGKKLRHRVVTLSMNTRLPVLSQTPRALRVATPDDGNKWLPKSRATVYRSERAIPRPTGRDLVRTAKTFLHQPYVWAGRSGFGFDCSGLTGTVYQVHGITIPRDSGPQAQDPRARRVAAKNLRAGDLLFYSHSTDADDIYHVAMYVGNGRMIEAFDHLTPVRVTAARLGENYWGAVRYLHG